ncbi:microfibril-associated glycoprotein 4-like [Armigeres subalbatus]|uniref:microfibril-associated glycoprotein 4-like n=1 Tax=Armigeres subalbatus TaxID=124917 RepID=UPI002ED5AF44
MVIIEAIVCGLFVCSGLLAESVIPNTEVPQIATENDNTSEYKVVVSKIEKLEQQLLEQQLEIRKQNELILSVLDSFRQNVESKILSQKVKINQRYDELERALISLEKSDEKMLSILTSVKRAVDHKFGDLFAHFNIISSSSPTYRSCKDEPTRVTGQYLLKPFPREAPFEGYCEQDKFGGGWLVIQRRFDGSVDFFRNWTEYKNGFGRIDGEFWLGLEQMHRLTKDKNHVLLVELEAYDGDSAYAMYDGFEIGTESELYELKVLGSYNGTAGDSLTHHQGEPFSTYDNDNDISFSNCAAQFHGAWWYRNCHLSHLNGQYKNESGLNTNLWYAFKERNGLKLTRMMIREK